MIAPMIYGNLWLLTARQAKDSTRSHMNKNLHGLGEILNTWWLASAAAKVTERWTCFLAGS